jgi:hypothetical protein
LPSVPHRDQRVREVLEDRSRLTTSAHDKALDLPYAPVGVALYLRDMLP